MTARSIPRADQNQPVTRLIRLVRDLPSHNGGFEELRTGSSRR